MFIDKFISLVSIKTSNRIQWIDNAKGICMLFVILVHSGYMPELYKRFLEPFFLSGFFLLSGYLFHNPAKHFNLKNKIIKIVEGILIPYLIYWILSYLIKHIIDNDLNLILLLKELAYGNKLWFMASLIVSQLIFSIFLSINKSIVTVILFSFISIVIWYVTPLSTPMLKMPWSLNVSMVSNFFLGIGYLLRIYSNQLDNLLKKIYLNIFMCFVYVAFVLFNYLHISYDFNYPANTYGNIVIFTIVSLLGCYCLLFISSIIRNNLVLMFVGSNSLLFYFYQNQVLGVLKKIFSMIMGESPNYILPFFMIAFVVIFLVLPINITNRFLPIMIGKSSLFKNRN